MSSGVRKMQSKEGTFTSLFYLESKSNKNSFEFQKETEIFKLQTIQEMKCVFQKINFLKEILNYHPAVNAICTKVSMEKFC